jgi:ketosteroid isomerase-like protein
MMVPTAGGPIVGIDGMADARDLLDRYARAWETFDGDLWTSLFSEDAEYSPDPFEPPLVGHNALRALLLVASRTEEQAEMIFERHWVSGPTVLAAWHASFVRRTDRARVRIAGFLTLETDADGRIARHRAWWHRRETPAA